MFTYCGKSTTRKQQHTVSAKVYKQFIAEKITNKYFSICGQVTATPTFGVLQSGNNIALSIHIPQQRRMSNSAMNSPLSPLSPSTAPTITGKRRNKAVFIIDAVTTQVCNSPIRYYIKYYSVKYYCED